jgi:predicted site-specific integrase-resolvase
MKLSQWAKNKGIAYKTAHRWFQKGMIEGAHQEKNGSIFVEEGKIDETIGLVLERIEERLEDIMVVIGKNSDRKDGR